MKLHAILPGRLYQRGYFADKSAAEKLAMLHSSGITVVVTLYGHFDHHLLGHVEYIHAPFPDNDQVPVELVQAIAKHLSERIISGGAVLVACQSGRNRSSLINALVVRTVLGVSGGSALRTVRSGRPGALVNEAYVRFLTDLPVLRVAL